MNLPHRPRKYFFFNSVRGDYFYVYIYTQHENDGENWWERRRNVSEIRLIIERLIYAKNESIMYRHRYMHGRKTGGRDGGGGYDFQSGNIDIRRTHIFMGLIKIGRATTRRRRRPRRKNRKNFTHARRDARLSWPCILYLVAHSRSQRTYKP